MKAQSHTEDLLNYGKCGLVNEQCIVKRLQELNGILEALEDKYLGLVMREGMEKIDMYPNSLLTTGVPEASCCK